MKELAANIQRADNIVPILTSQAEAAIGKNSPTGELKVGKAGLARQNEEESGFRKSSALSDRSTVVHSHRLKREISGYGWLVGRAGQGCWQNLSAGRQGSEEKKDGLAGMKARMRRIDSGHNGLTAGEIFSPEVPQRQRFGRRIRNKISTWARETKNAVKGRGRI